MMLFFPTEIAHGGFSTRCIPHSQPGSFSSDRGDWISAFDKSVDFKFEGFTNVDGFVEALAGAHHQDCACTAIISAETSATVIEQGACLSILKHTHVGSCMVCVPEQLLQS